MPHILCDNCEKLRPQFSGRFCPQCICKSCKVNYILGAASNMLNDNYERKLCSDCNIKLDTVVFYSGSEDNSKESEESDEVSNPDSGLQRLDEVVNQLAVIGNSSNSDPPFNLEITSTEDSFEKLTIQLPTTDLDNILADTTIDIGGVDETPEDTNNQTNMSSAVERDAKDQVKMSIIEGDESNNKEQDAEVSETMEIASKQLSDSNSNADNIGEKSCDMNNPNSDNNEINNSPTAGTSNTDNQLSTNGISQMLDQIKLLNPGAIRSSITKELSGLGHSAMGESTDGELRLASCKALQEATMLNANDVFLDAGSSGGTTVFTLVCLTGCTGIGVEMEYLRWVLSIRHLKTFLDTYVDSDMKIYFAHRNIFEFKSFEGVTVLYTFDYAFGDCEKYEQNFIPAINNTKSLRCFVSTKNFSALQSLQLHNSWAFDQQIKLSNIGGQCNRVFYVYKREPSIDQSDSNLVEDEYMTKCINTATYRAIRTHYVEESYHSFLHAKSFPRTIPAEVVIQTEASKETCLTQAKKLYNLLESGDYHANPHLEHHYPPDSIIVCTTPKYRYYYDKSRLEGLVYPASTKFYHGMASNYNQKSGKANHAVIFPSMSSDRKSMVYGALWRGTKDSVKVVIYHFKTNGFTLEKLEPIIGLYDFESNLPDDIDWVSIRDLFFQLFKFRMKLNKSDEPPPLEDEVPPLQDAIETGSSVIDDIHDDLSVEEIESEPKSSKGKVGKDSKSSKRVAATQINQLEKKIEATENKRKQAEAELKFTEDELKRVRRQMKKEEKDKGVLQSKITQLESKLQEAKEAATTAAAKAAAAVIAKQHAKLSSSQSDSSGITTTTSSITTSSSSSSGAIYSNSHVDVTSGSSSSCSGSNPLVKRLKLELEKAKKDCQDIKDAAVADKIKSLTDQVTKAEKALEDAAKAAAEREENIKKAADTNVSNIITVSKDARSDLLELARILRPCVDVPPK